MRSSICTRLCAARSPVLSDRLRVRATKPYVDRRALSNRRSGEYDDSLVTPLSVIRAAWIVWLISWLAAAAWSDRTVRRPAVRREVLYRVLTLAGAMLMFGFNPDGERADTPLWSVASGIGWVLAGVVMCGFVFVWWARIHLGQLWSSSVTRKEHHHVVDTGPYAIVRHAIYTGLLLAIIATMLLRGTILTVTGSTLIAMGIYVKARVEEEFLRQQLGESYDAYARRVPMLVPFLRFRSYLVAKTRRP
jgi:protein-S-isoprenylcysteine O-methyltransferase Ste14